MSYKQFRSFNKRQSKSKYRNHRCEYNGIKFDSEKERDYYLLLLDMQRKGKITGLELQVPFELQPKFVHNGETIRAIKYVADFTYYDSEGKFHIVDTKGMKTDVYQLKKKMMLYQGYEIEEK